MNLASLKEFLPFVQMMINGAAQNADPDIYANLILDQLGLEKAADIITIDANYEKLFIYVLAAVPHRDWFDSVRKAVIYYIEQSNQANAHVPAQPAPPPQSTTESEPTSGPSAASVSDPGSESGAEKPD